MEQLLTRLFIRVTLESFLNTLIRQGSYDLDWVQILLKNAQVIMIKKTKFLGKNYSSITDMAPCQEVWGVPKL